LYISINAGFARNLNAAQGFASRCLRGIHQGTALLAWCLYFVDLSCFLIVGISCPGGIIQKKKQVKSVPIHDMF